MICIVALVVFAVMAIFSARYRPLAKEAFDCTFRKITFRKCRTNLNERIRSKITGKLMRTPKVARFTYKYFQFLSVIFTILFILSIVFTGIGVYNYVVYGNCNGPNGGVCIFEPLDVGSCGDGCVNPDCDCGITSDCDCPEEPCK